MVDGRARRYKGEVRNLPAGILCDTLVTLTSAKLTLFDADENIVIGYDSVDCDLNKPGPDFNVEVGYVFDTRDSHLVANADYHAEFSLFDADGLIVIVKIKLTIEGMP